MAIVTAQSGAITVTFDGDFVEISTKMLLGKPKVVRIPASSIRMIEFEPPKTLSGGWIRFLTDSQGSRSVLRSTNGREVMRDPQSVIFTRKDEAKFAALRHAVEDSMRR